MRPGRHPQQPVGGAVSIVNGAGIDSVQFGASGLGTVSLHNVTINNGNGSASVPSTVAFAANTNTVTGNLNVTGGDGADGFGLNCTTFTVTGAMTVNHGAGGSIASIVNIAASSTNAIGGLLTVTGGQGNDSLVFGGSTLNLHSVAVNQGNGDNSILFNAAANTITGNLSITNGDGVDTFGMVATSFTVTGNVTIANGAGGSTTIFDATSSNAIGGALTLTNGDGIDVFNTAGASFAVTGAMTVSQGNGSRQHQFQCLRQ